MEKPKVALMFGALLLLTVLLDPIVYFLSLDYVSGILLTKHRLFDWYGAPTTSSMTINSMLHDRDPELLLMEDKLQGRRIAEKEGVPCPELLWYGFNADDIPFDELPPEYIIKATHLAQHGNILMSRGTDLRSGMALTNEEIRSRAASWLRTRHHGIEWAAHMNPNPAIIIEAVLSAYPGAGGQWGGSIGVDYKMYVIDGRVEFLYTTSTANASAYESHSGLRRAAAAAEPTYGITYTIPPFDGKAWRDLGYTIAMKGMFGLGTPLPSHTHLPTEPPELQTLIAYAERLGKRTDFVRVDFMLTAQGWVFIEFTNYPFGGMYTIEPRWLDYELARKWAVARAKKYG
eukprot:m.431279 g.431279  ORF g.431279 m.431279 type:complete len:345 (-) comp21400_c0_seq1:57-1091(-)